MADDRSLSDLLWDYTLYAPIGLAISIAEELPKLSEKGRERIAGRVQIAGVIGRFAFGEAQRRVGRILGQESRPPSTVSEEPKASPLGPAPVPPPGRESPPAPHQAPVPGHASARPASSADADPSSVLKSSAHRSSNGSRAGRSSTAKQHARNASTVVEHDRAREQEAPELVKPAPAARSLAIPGYDTLAASQVVQRLSSLRPDELDAVRRYEIATRGRRTILHRIAQLAADR